MSPTYTDTASQQPTLAFNASKSLKAVMNTAVLLTIFLASMVGLA